MANEAVQSSQLDGGNAALSTDQADIPNVQRFGNTRTTRGGGQNGRGNQGIRSKGGNSHNNGYQGYPAQDGRHPQQAGESSSGEVRNERGYQRGYQDENFPSNRAGQQQQSHPRGYNSARGSRGSQVRFHDRENRPGNAVNRQSNSYHPDHSGNMNTQNVPEGNSKNGRHVISSGAVNQSLPGSQDARLLPSVVLRQTAVQATTALKRPAPRKEEKNQRERLMEDLTKERLECQFCYDRMWTKQAIWNCESCYNVFHLKCVRNWATTCMKDSEDGIWRCMICQVILQEEPRQYFCFCRKQENPEWNPNITPHSCGQICEKGSAKGNAGAGCDHPCTCLCHPGPCPPCQRQVTRSCGCGKTSLTEQCSCSTVHTCSNTCHKVLSCGTHHCTQLCHAGPCEVCSVTIDKACHCEKVVRVLSCVENSSLRHGFSCVSVCGKQLDCANHFCQGICHPGPCPPCARLPGLVKTCACGKRKMEELRGKPRKSCLDHLPTCGDVCGRMLSCGSAKSPHFCASICHDATCPPCDKKTAVSCCCGSSTQVIQCCDLTLEVRQWKCPKKCQKKMLCGRHKCDNICCNYDEHICLKTCGKRLSCGLHNCEDPCGHPGNCRRCLNTSFEERTCECGYTIQHPPIPCGAPLPDCPRPCSRVHACGHPPTHSCHGEVQCPPCTYLCEKTCYAGHETRKNIACHVAGISCGRPCGKELACGVHKCKRLCHGGECQEQGEKCVQLCSLVYRKCGHACAVACHGLTKCVVTQCKAMVDVTCECKLRKDRVACHQHEKFLKEYLKRKGTADAGKKGFKLDDLRYAMPTDVLECDEECLRVTRNKGMAAALNIDADKVLSTSSTGPPIPIYSEQLKQIARQNLKWATQIENIIMALVKNVKDSAAKRRMHQMQPMNYEQRKFVHELASFYGCTTESYDVEPLRNVAVVAKLDSALMPVVPLFQVVAAERPAKQTAKCPFKPSNALSTQVTHSTIQKMSVNVSTGRKSEMNNGPSIDYFDYSD